MLVVHFHILPRPEKLNGVDERQKSYCCILTSDPAKHAIPKTAEVHIPLGWMRLGWQYGTGLKSHRLMHWKRVTCELHDSYFRLMTIKHAIPKEVALNYYITEGTGNSISLERSCGREKQHPAEGALRTPDWVLETRPDQLETKCGRESLRLSNPGERERNADGHKNGGQYVAVLFGLQLPLTHNPFK